MVAVAVPEILPLFIPAAVVFWWVRRRYLRTSREVKRFEATTRSPVYASFSSILKVRTCGAAVYLVAPLTGVVRGCGRSSAPQWFAVELSDA